MERKFVSLLPMFLFISLLLLSGSRGIVFGDSAARLNVIVTIPPQAFLVESIVGERAKVTSLVPEDGSPHTSSLTPEKIKKIRKAGIYFRVGTPLPFEENNLAVFREENPELVVVNTSRGVKLKSLDKHYGESTADHPGQNNKVVDNHVWLSPPNLKVMARNIFKGMSELDPSSKQYYEKNLEELLKKISGADDRLSGILGDFAGRSFLVYHPAWGYFGDEFKLHQVAVQEKGDKPGPGRVREIANFAKKHRIDKIIASSQFSPSTAKMVSRTFGGSVATINPLEKDILTELIGLAKEIAEGYRKS